MPQLDIYIMSSQIFWLLIKFNIFYYFILQNYIVEVLKVFKFRNKLICSFQNVEKENSNNINFLTVLTKKKVLVS